MIDPQGEDTQVRIEGGGLHFHQLQDGQNNLQNEDPVLNLNNMIRHIPSVNQNGGRNEIRRCLVAIQAGNRICSRTHAYGTLILFYFRSK